MKLDLTGNAERGAYYYLAPESLPVLVLATRQEPGHGRDWAFRQPERWLPVKHQTAGVGCHQHQMWALELQAKPEFREFMWRLGRDYRLEDVGALQPASLDDILYYRQRLSEHGVDCNWSYSSLEEAIYPIDCDPEAIRAISTTEVPDDLDDLLDWEDDPLRCFGFISRWELFVLTENSD